MGPVWDSCLDLISANDHIPLGQRTRCFLGGLHHKFLYPYGGKIEVAQQTASHESA